jgi:hypothetical protein
MTRPARRRWRLGAQAFVLLILCLVGSIATGRVVLEAIGRGPAAGDAWGGETGGSGSGGTAGFGGSGSDRQSRAAAADVGGRARGDADSNVVEMRIGAPGRGRGGASEGSGGGSAGGARGGGGFLTIRFEPTARLKLFLGQLDRLDREENIRSVQEFLTEFGPKLTLQQRAPVQTFYDQLAGGASMLEATAGTMHQYGPAGRDALETVFDLKRAAAEQALQKYRRLQAEGHGKPHKIDHYEQRIWMLDELRAEFNRSFSIE